MSRIVMVALAIVSALAVGVAIGGVSAFRDLGATVRLSDRGTGGVTIDVPPSAVGSSAPPAGGVDGVKAGRASGVLLSALRDGGYIIYIQHTATNRQDNDDEDVDFQNCAAQINLSDAGRLQARQLGEAFKTLGIPVGRVIASPLCRTRETAELAFGRADLNPLLAVTDIFVNESNAQRASALRAILAGQPAAGANTVVVGHWQNLASAVGVHLEGDGEAAVFRGDGKGTPLLFARVTADGWLPTIP